jgi:hypothetical protein
MRSRLGQWAPLSFALAMAGAVLLGPATKARATLTLVATETGGPTLVAQDNQGMGVAINAGALGPLVTTIADSLPATGQLGLGGASGVMFGDFLVSGSLSTSNSPGFPTLAQLISSSLSVVNTTAVAHTITLQISDNGFTRPTPPLFGATAGGTFNIATDPNTGAPLASNVNGNSANALAFANFSNTLFGTGVTVQNFTFSTDTTNLTSSSYANTVPNTILGPGTIPYSMTVELVFTIAGNNQLSSRNDTITAINVVPEPATLAMAFSALPLLGLAAWRRRRKSA